MNETHHPNAPSNFVTVGNVTRRKRGAAFLRTLGPAEADVVEAYARACEIVMAGGANIAASGGCAGGTPSREGRQFHAVRFVEFVRRLDRAIGPDAIRFKPRGAPAVVIPVLDLWRATVVWGRPLADIMASKGLKRVPRREKIIRAALEAAATRAAAEKGRGGDPVSDD